MIPPASRTALIVGIGGIAVSGAGWLMAPAQFFPGWLAAVTLFAAWPLGSIALLLTHTLTGGRWGYVLRPALRLGVWTLPLLPPAALLMLDGLASLYPWARPEIAMHLDNRFYLNPPFFAARMVTYLVVWCVLGWIALDERWSQAAAPAGLFVLAITTTFAAIDTTLSLDPHFMSSVEGMIQAARMGLLALAIAVVASVFSTSADQRGDLGKLLLALVILGAYLDFMQVLIVWQSNLPDEAPWYVTRFRGGWLAVSILLVTIQFLLPFFLLLWPRLQQSRRVIVRVAGMLVAAAILRAWWTVLPSVGQSLGWIDVGCMAGLLGLGAGLASWRARRDAIATGPGDA